MPNIIIIENTMATCHAFAMELSMTLKEGGQSVSIALATDDTLDEHEISLLKKHHIDLYGKDDFLSHQYNYTIEMSRIMILQTPEWLYAGISEGRHTVEHVLSLLLDNYDFYVFDEQLGVGHRGFQTGGQIIRQLVEYCSDHQINFHDKVSILYTAQTPEVQTVEYLKGTATEVIIKANVQKVVARIAEYYASASIYMKFDKLRLLFHDKESYEDLPFQQWTKAYPFLCHIGRDALEEFEASFDTLNELSQLLDKARRDLDGILLNSNEKKMLLSNEMTDLKAIIITGDTTVERIKSQMIGMFSKVKDNFELSFSDLRTTLGLPIVTSELRHLYCDKVRVKNALRKLRAQFRNDCVIDIQKEDTNNRTRHTISFYCCFPKDAEREHIKTDNELQLYWQTDRSILKLLFNGKNERGQDFATIKNDLCDYFIFIFEQRFAGNYACLMCHNTKPDFNKADNDIEDIPEVEAKVYLDDKKLDSEGFRISLVYFTPR